MEKLKEYKYIIIIMLLILGLGFYWYELRPGQIKKECEGIATEDARKSLKTKVELGADELYKVAAEKDLFLKDDYKSYYEHCLSRNGL